MTPDNSGQRAHREKLGRIFASYREQYAGSQLIQDYAQGGAETGLVQVKLIHCLTMAVVDNDESVCLELVREMCGANVPFMIVAHEISYLRDALIRIAVRDRDLDAVSAAVTFFDYLEDLLARVYLDAFLLILANRNHLRLRHISALSEKNLLIHFENHLRWMVQLTEAVARRQPARMPEGHHEKCAFGNWLHGDGADLIRDKSHYKQVVRLHQDMHDVVAELGAAMANDVSRSLPLYALLKKAESYSLELGNEIAMLNSMVIMTVYNKDHMTGLLTRRTLDRILINQLEISKATDTPFCLLMCDLDHFKEINDVHGHLVGDQAILHFVGLARDSIRQVDLMFRYGGEEFLFILPATGYENALKLAENMRAQLNSKCLEVNGVRLDVRASFGLLEVSGNKVPFIDQELANELIKECDQRLYIAKHRGRNQVA